MMGIVGIVFVFVMVFGGFLLHGGNIMVVIHALPTELMTIFGGAIGAMIVGNSADTLKGVGKGIKQVGRSRTSRTCCACCSRSPK